MKFLIKYWYVALPIALALLGGFGYLVYDYTSTKAENRALKIDIQALEDTIEDYAAEVDQCVSDKTLTEKTSNGYQTSIRSLRSQLDSMRSRGEARCVPTEPAGATHGRDGTPAGTELPSGNGVRAGYLIDFGGRCEETRLKLLACQSFVNDLYLSRGVNQ